MDNDSLTITVTRGTAPVLVTGDADVVGAVVEALVRALKGPEQRRVVRLVDRTRGGDTGQEAGE